MLSPSRNVLLYRLHFCWDFFLYISFYCFYFVYITYEPWKLFPEPHNNPLITDENDVRQAANAKPFTAEHKDGNSGQCAN